MLKMRLILGLYLVMLAGCATSETVPIVVNKPAESEILIQMDEIMPSRAVGLNGGIQGDFVTLRHPTSVSARNNDVYLVDVGLGKIFRYDFMQRTLATFIATPVYDLTRVYVAQDMTVYVADPKQKQVLHFARNGDSLPSFSSAGNLLRPIAIAEDTGGGRVLVADGVYDQIVVFNSMGMMLSTIKSDHVTSITSIAAGPDGIYILDGMAKKVLVLDWQGELQYTLGEGDLTAPSAIAVSRENEIFVADNFDHTIKMYSENHLMGSVGGFSDIGGLATDQGLLFVADSMAARMRVMRINRRP